MISRKNRRVILLGLLVALASLLFVVSSAEESESCGPFFERTLFTYVVHPDLPLEKYAAGELGILKPQFARSYLAVAYRYLMDKPLTSTEQREAHKLWNYRLFESDRKTYVEIDSTVAGWDSLVRMVLADPETPSVSGWSTLPSDKYESYYSIGPDALQNAAKRLQGLIKQFGINSKEARDWVTNQQLAFAEEGAIPEEISDVTSVIGVNRQYQTATAYFYRARYDEAHVRFQKIAQNNASPWKKLGLYLASRALTRKATIGGDSSALIQAIAVLDRIDEPELRKAVLFQKDYVQGRLDPESQILHLSKRILDDDEQYFEHELDDYTKLLDRVLGEQGWYYGDERLFDRLQAKLRVDDMTDWIYTFQSSDSLSLAHAIERYRVTRSKPWLIAVLSKLQDYRSEYFDSGIASDDPAYASVVYHRARLLSKDGQSDRTKKLLDEALQTNVGHSARNDIMILRQQYASDMRDLITMLARMPLGVSYEYDYREWADPEIKVTDPAYDTAALQVLNRTLSLDRLMEAVRLNVLPLTPQLDLMRSVWARSVILGREEYAKEVAAKLAVVDTVLSSPLRRYLNASTTAERHREGIYILLKYPGLSPLIWLAPGRRDIDHTDSFRANGWCPIYVNPPNISEEDRPYRALILDAAPVAFLTAADRAQADLEWQELAESSPAVNYLANETVKWAKALPKDPRAPEVLHLAVKASRYGCNDKHTGKFSSAAYKLLYGKYGKTTWAKQTPYWFGEY